MIPVSRTYSSQESWHDQFSDSRCLSVTVFSFQNCQQQIPEGLDFVNIQGFRRRMQACHGRLYSNGIHVRDAPHDYIDFNAGVLVQATDLASEEPLMLLCKSGLHYAIPSNGPRRIFVLQVGCEAKHTHKLFHAAMPQKTNGILNAADDILSCKNTIRQRNRTKRNGRNDDIQILRVALPDTGMQFVCTVP